MKALELDDHLSEAHAALGWIRMVYDRDHDAAETELRRAIALNPNYAVAHAYIGGYLTALGRFDEAIAERKAALRLDPLSYPLRTASCWTFYFARRPDAAIAECGEALALQPNFSRAHLYTALAYENKRMYLQALAELEKALQTAPDNGEVLASMAHVYAASGRRDEAQRISRQLDALSTRQHVDPYFMALVRLALGEQDQAFRLLEQAIEERSIMLLWFKVEPRLDVIRSDPRYRDLVRRVGLAD
jgi:tetratricopeptide (TPR) repeat protein